MSNFGTFEQPQTTDTLGPESSQSNDSSLEHFRLISDRLSPEHLNCSTDQPILEALKLPELDELSLQEDSKPKELVCLLCPEEFASDQVNSLLKHLLTKHNFVIADVPLIADLDKYIRYWKSKFKEKPLTAYCTTMRADVSEKGSEYKVEEREFSLLSDIVPEDRQLRQQLQIDRLEQVLKIHELENKNKNFCRGCLFCKMTFTEHASLFDHMAFGHNFSVGQPANLVFVNKFLNILEEKLENLICLFCEKTFKSREVLKEHMRKKAHKKLNPQNKLYDEFYLVNYLEFGKNWEDLSREVAGEDEDEVTSGFHVEKDDNYDWSDWKDNVGRTICLFCQANYIESKDLFQHMVEIHGFNFQKIRDDQSLDFYQQVKMINYIRRCVHLNTCIGCGTTFPDQSKMLEHLSWSDHYTPPIKEWNQPQFYFPTYENDNLLHCLDEGDADKGSSPVVVPEQVVLDVSDSILQDETVRRSLIPRTSNR